MAAFKFAALVNSPLARIVTAALGANSSTPLGDKDIGKAVKLGASDNYAPCADGDHIDGFVVAMAGGPTVSGGFSLGSVQLDREHVVQVVSGGAQVAVNDLIVSGTPLAVGTAGYAQVKKQTKPTDATTLAAAYGKPIWRCKSIVSGTGVAGDLLLIERVG